MLTYILIVFIVYTIFTRKYPVWGIHFHDVTFSESHSEPQSYRKSHEKAPDKTEKVSAEVKVLTNVLGFCNISGGTTEKTTHSVGFHRSDGLAEEDEGENDSGHYEDVSPEFHSFHICSFISFQLLKMMMVTVYRLPLMISPFQSSMPSLNTMFNSQMIAIKLQ